MLGGFFNHIYQGCLPRFPTTEDFERHESYVTLLCKLCVSAEKFRRNELANKFMDDIQDTELLTVKQLRFIYENTRKRSQLRRYGIIVQMYKATCGDQSFKSISVRAKASRGTNAAIDKLQQKYEALFYPAVGHDADPRVRSKHRFFRFCFFHTHAEGEECHKRGGEDNETARRAK